MSLRRNLIAGWCPSLGPTAGTLLDRFSRNNHGTLTNMDPSTDWVASGGNWALDFDGTDDYVSAGQKSEYAIGTTGQLSFSIWMRSASIPSTASLISRSAAAAIAGRWALFGAGTSWTLLATAAGNGSASASGTVANATDGNWHCWVGVFGGETHQLFVDGVQRATGTYNEAATNTIAARTLLFGKYNDATGGETGTTFQFPGQLDDILIWNRKITQAEAVELYRIGRGGIYRQQRRTRYASVRRFRRRQYAQLVGGGIV